MRKILLASSLVVSLIMIGCGNRSTALVQEQELAVQSASLNANTNTIVTDEDYTTVTLLGEFGSSVYINGEEVGIFPETGSLEITFDIGDVGSYVYNVIAKSSDGVESQEIVIEVFKQEKSASLGTVSTEGEASALTVSQDGIIFVAEKSHGVEIISIGYDDVVSSDLLATIDNINASNVILSSDETKLYVEDENGQFHVLDISDISNPVELDIISQIEESNEVMTEDGTTRYRVGSCGLIGEDISNPATAARNFLIEDKDIEDVVLVENDMQMIVAHASAGLQLYDISDAINPIMIGEKNLHDKTSGLSLLKRDGILFVANGASGVEIFNLDILLHEMVQ